MESANKTMTEETLKYLKKRAFYCIHLATTQLGPDATFEDLEKRSYQLMDRPMKAFIDKEHCPSTIKETLVSFEMEGVSKAYPDSKIEVDSSKPLDPQQAIEIKVKDCVKYTNQIITATSDEIQGSFEVNLSPFGKHISTKAVCLYQDCGWDTKPHDTEGMVYIFTWPNA